MRYQIDQKNKMDSKLRILLIDLEWQTESEKSQAKLTQIIT